MEVLEPIPETHAYFELFHAGEAALSAVSIGASQQALALHCLRWLSMGYAVRMVDADYFNAFDWQEESVYDELGALAMVRTRRKRITPY